MKNPIHINETVLQPGDFHFGDANTRVRTLLGSCVSITMWHPAKLIGGMCHYMLPSRNVARIETLDGRYADEAIILLFQEAVRYNTNPKDYIVKVFGAGNMFPDLRKCIQEKNHAAHNSVPRKNTEIIHTLASSYGFAIEAHDLGGDGHRNIIFDIWSGHVWVRQVKAVKTFETGVIFEKNQGIVG